MLFSLFIHKHTDNLGRRTVISKTTWVRISIPCCVPREFQRTLKTINIKIPELFLLPPCSRFCTGISPAVCCTTAPATPHRQTLLPAAELAPGQEDDGQERTQHLPAQDL